VREAAPPSLCTQLSNKRPGTKGQQIVYLRFYAFTHLYNKGERRLLPDGKGARKNPPDLSIRFAQGKLLIKGMEYFL
jgi:hypothetical protein